jgi:hypothetical protein
MSERSIVGKSSEPMAMDTCKHLRPRPAIIPPLTAIIWSTREETP